MAEPDYGARMKNSHHFTLAAVLSFSALALSPAGFGQVEALGAILPSADPLVPTSYALSADGSTVALTTAPSTFNSTTASTWTADDGLVELPAIGISPSTFAISDDGRFVAGITSWYTGVRWGPSGAESLGTVGATKISGDGSTIGGSLTFGPSTLHAFRWTDAAGVVDIHPAFATGSSYVGDISGDGSVVAGWGQTGSVMSEAFVWTAATGSVQLVAPPGTVSVQVQGMSDDGSVLSGVGDFGSGIRQPFRWTAATGVVPLGIVTPGISAFNAFVTDDGSVLFGNAGGAFAWTPSGGYQIASAFDLYTATAASADGSVIVGYVRDSNVGEDFAAVWTSTGVELLESLGGDSHRATDVSADGNVVLGVAEVPDGRRLVVRWRLDDQIGSTYCSPAVPNSSGGPATLTLSGTNVSAIGHLELRASGLPTDSFGFFITSRDRASIAMPGGSSGTLCLGGSIGRLVGPGQIQNSGSAGAFTLTIDPSSLPSPTGPILPSFGERWNFQAWFRDANPQVTSNFTSGATVRIQ